ncbi:MAG: ABC transporter ATP-binding protein [Clostridiales bacterium]|nr:ABC transporter ATP-binding protein [Clostridiales bacterium]
MIYINNITKSFGNKKVLENFSLKIEQGEFVGIMGSSGKGKSTLLNIIGSLESCDAGEIIIDGMKNVKPNSAKSRIVLRNIIGYLFQNFALIDNETVMNNLVIALKYTGLSKKQKKEEIKRALTFVGLEGFEKNKIYELSGGEQQRVAIARLFLKPSKIILADEPTGSLDEDNANKIIEFLKKLNEKGKTIVIVTHDKRACKYCNRIVNL